MRRLAVIGLAVLCLGLLSQPAARADSSLQSVLFNVNGTTQTNSFTGFNTGSWNATTGIGTLTYVFNPGAPGNYNFTAFFDNQLTPDFWNESGSVTGAPAAGQSWEIGDSFGSSIYGDASNGTLNNSNMLPGGTSNFLLDCTGASCNGDAALAMGFHFALTAGQEAVITLTFSTSAPGGGFFLTQTHPIDGGSDSSSSIYFSGNEVARGGVVVGTPEPGSLLLLSLALAGLCLIKGRKLVSAAI